MFYLRIFIVVLFCSSFANQAWATDAAKQMLVNLALDSELTFDAQAGREHWYREEQGRSCTSCHLDSLHAPGRHERTGKVIEPMAPSVNQERLQDIKKIKKWFLRNCKWTYKRECTAQEKGDILTWLIEQ